MRRPTYHSLTFKVSGCSGSDIALTFGTHAHTGSTIKLNAVLPLHANLSVSWEQSDDFSTHPT